MIAAGIDVGSKATKAVVVDADRRILGRGVARTRPDFPGVAAEALGAALRAAGLDADACDYVATTGFGRYSVPSRDLQITEITCAAQGSAFLFPATASVLDIGAQSTRAVGLRDHGRVREFKSNDKCAAGAGGFLERAARYLEVPLDELGELSLRATSPQPISSVCAVLAESEIINHVSAGQSVENIVRGIHEALAARASTLLARVGLAAELTLVGGVARQRGMVKALEDATALRVNVPEEPETVAALGAALLAMSRLERKARDA
ncbi:MAG TPA: acyl-CoA dehydratase activase [Vicinamibacteria bacterium]|nr:acyl-CoA dehydratase activase [Vicinamibacteria bacterium]